MAGSRGRTRAHTAASSSIAARPLSRLPVPTLAGGVPCRATIAGRDKGARISWRSRYSLPAPGNLARRSNWQAVMEAAIASALRVASQSRSCRPRRRKSPIPGPPGGTRAASRSGRHPGPTVRDDHQRRRCGATRSVVGRGRSDRAQRFGKRHQARHRRRPCSHRRAVDDQPRRRPDQPRQSHQASNVWAGEISPTRAVSHLAES
jgi:hypothetical protein